VTIDIAVATEDPTASLLHADVGQDLGADPASQRGLNERILDHRPHRRQRAMLEI
jgi:hypothetical protein